MGKLVPTKTKTALPLLIPTGSAMLNLVLSNTVDGAFVPGSMVNIIGDSSSGKTFLAWSIFAEMIHSEEFEEYDLVYDEPEAKFQWLVDDVFSPKMKRVEMGPKVRSDTIELFYKKVKKRIKIGIPFVYVLDSFDSLTDIEEKAKEEIERDYPAKPRLASEMFRKICRDIEKTKSLLIVISQTRTAIGIKFGKKISRSGGKALKFYCMQELWLAVRNHVRRKKRDVGVNVKAKTEKNHLTGRLRECEFPVIYDYGLDDITSCIDWMVGEGFWDKPEKKQTIDTGRDFGKLTAEKLIKRIEKRGEEAALHGIVGECWQEIEESIKTMRKKRYE